MVTTTLGNVKTHPQEVGHALHFRPEIAGTQILRKQNFVQSLRGAEQQKLMQKHRVDYTPPRRVGKPSSQGTPMPSVRDYGARKRLERTLAVSGREHDLVQNVIALRLVPATRLQRGQRQWQTPVSRSTLDWLPQTAPRLPVQQQQHCQCQHMQAQHWQQGGVPLWPTDRSSTQYAAPLHLQPQLLRPTVAATILQLLPGHT